MKKSNFQNVIFAIIVVIINRHTQIHIYLFFKNIFNDFLTEGKGGINMD